MAEDINGGFFSGYIPRDARFVTGGSGKPFIGLTIGADAGYKDRESGEWVKRNHWVDFIYRIDSEKLAAALVEGRRVRVRYHLESSTKEVDGQKRTTIYHVIDELDFLRSNKPEGDGAEKQTNTRQRATSTSTSTRSRRPAPASAADDGEFEEDIWNQ